LGEPKSAQAGFNARYFDKPEWNPGKQSEVREPFRALCGKCGATRTDAQLGLELTPELYVEHMVAVFREVRRVLRPDGVLWLNLGDSYGRTQESNVPQTRNPRNSYPQHCKEGSSDGLVGRAERPGGRAASIGLKPKDLVGIPWRVAFALQADGWWLRSDVIWSKPNPMPESVTDRPTRSHEYLFLLSKSERYYYDAAAIFESFTGEPKTPGGYCPEKAVGPQSRNGHSQWDRARTKERSQPNAGRNARSVWTIATQPYPSAHFATFPEELARRCILAGSKPGDTVLDPFGGSGTVAQVATGNGRHSIYIDLNPNYLELARQRIGPMFCEEIPA
jgi:DNA modification methylase